MKVLYILKHDPWGIGGGCYASRCYFEAFETIFANAQFDVLCCSEFYDNILAHISKQFSVKAVPPMSKWTKLSSVATKVINRFHQHALNLIKRNSYDWCVFDHSSIAGSISKYCKDRGVRTIVINHNCEYDYYRDSHPQWYKTFATLPIIKWNENNAFLYCDFNIFLTQEDYRQFELMYGSSQTSAIVSGCFLHRDYSEKEPLIIGQHTNPKLVISGTIGNVQNMDGITHFLNHLYQYVPKNVEIVITGKNPPSSLIERISGFPNVNIVPNPKDINEVISTCDIFLCPTRLGGGMKLRIMDGLLAGLPVITHRVSARGYSSFVEKGFMEIYETEEQFQRALQRMLNNLSERRLKRYDIQAFARNEFSFEQKVRLLSDYIESF